jgi:hypothetical protein
MNENTNKSLKTHTENGDFAPGNIANPTGRPKKGNAWADVYNQILDSEKIDITLRSVDKVGGMILKKIILRTEKDDGSQAPTIRYALACAVVAEGLKGNIRAIQELADRTVGKPNQSITINEEEDIAEHLRSLSEIIRRVNTSTTAPLPDTDTAKIPE